MRNKIALIFGISGQDGAYLADFLFKKKYKLLGITRNNSKSNLFRLKKLKIEKKIKIYQNKILNSAFLKKIFNSNKIIGICEICKKNQAVDCHHLQYQCDSNENGFITNNNTSFNKNHEANLCAVCKECHDKIHSENKRYKRIKTSQGYEIIEI